MVELKDGSCDHRTNCIKKSKMLCGWYTCIEMYMYTINMYTLIHYVHVYACIPTTNHSLISCGSCITWNLYCLIDLSWRLHITADNRRVDSNKIRQVPVNIGNIL